MLKTKTIMWAFFIGYLMAMVGCSHKPVYEKMSVAYIVHLDMKHEDRKTRHSQYKPEDVRDANMDLVDQMVNKELHMQYDEIPNE